LWKDAGSPLPKPVILADLFAEWQVANARKIAILGDPKHATKGLLATEEEQLEKVRAAATADWRKVWRQLQAQIDESEAFLFFLQSQNYIYDNRREDVFKRQLSAMRKIFNLVNAKTVQELAKHQTYLDGRAKFLVDIEALNAKIASLEIEKNNIGEQIRPLRKQMEEIAVVMVGKNCLSQRLELRAAECVQLQSELNTLIAQFDPKETQRRSLFAAFQQTHVELEGLKSAYASFDSRHIPRLGFEYTAGKDFITVKSIVPGTLVDRAGLVVGDKVYAIGFNEVNGSKKISNPILGELSDVVHAMFMHIGKEEMHLAVRREDGVRVGLRVRLEGN
jgi:hypothetical protein